MTDLEAILGRTPVRLDEGNIRAKLSGQTIVVTGAGGSIGSELCRQVTRFRPAKLIAFDIAENSLYELQQEVSEIIPAIGSIQDARRVREVLKAHRPSIIYHAAAHKHVPLMEDHLFQAIENNVLGTCTLLEEATAAGVTDFMLISSDKAVRPAGVMGVTKRIAELLANSLAAVPERTASVRFGNVLGSSGSVVPLFRKQIAAGGPVTVTDPAMERYFMTITEAVLLVLQASAMSERREIFVLDMGEPLKILELARNMIRLSGLQPDVDIRIEYTGIRRGEKLCEELNTPDELMLSTDHEAIRVIRSASPALAGPERHADNLRRMCEDRDLASLLHEIRILVPEYTNVPVLKDFPDGPSL
jgi:FlaA1/EpsC-like NDP-sugar epimerase